MSTVRSINFEFDSQLDINHSYMPFIKGGGLFLPVKGKYVLGQEVDLTLKLPGLLEHEKIKARVVWITPENAINQAYSGVGIQLVGDHAPMLREKILSSIDNTVDVGGYIYGAAHEITA